MGPAEAGEARQQPAEREGADRADIQDLDGTTRVEAFEQAGDAVEAVAQRRQQAAALVGQRESARQAAEELDAEALFQPLHLMADRGLGDAELDRRPGEAEMAGRGFEGAQRVQGEMGTEHGRALGNLMAW